MVGLVITENYIIASSLTFTGYELDVVPLKDNLKVRRFPRNDYSVLLEGLKKKGLNDDKYYIILYSSHIQLEKELNPLIRALGLVRLSDYKLDNNKSLSTKILIDSYQISEILLKDYRREYGKTDGSEKLFIFEGIDNRIAVIPSRGNEVKIGRAEYIGKIGVDKTKNRLEKEILKQLKENGSGEASLSYEKYVNENIDDFFEELNSGSACKHNFSKDGVVSNFKIETYEFQNFVINNEQDAIKWFTDIKNNLNISEDQIGKMENGRIIKHLIAYGELFGYETVLSSMSQALKFDNKRNKQKEIDVLWPKKRLNGNHIIYTFKNEINSIFEKINTEIRDKIRIEAKDVLYLDKENRFVLDNNYLLLLHGIVRSIGRLEPEIRNSLTKGKEKEVEEFWEEIKIACTHSGIREDRKNKYIKKGGILGISKNDIDKKISTIVREYAQNGLISLADYFKKGELKELGAYCPGIMTYEYTYGNTIHIVRFLEKEAVSQGKIAYGNFELLYELEDNVIGGIETDIKELKDGFFFKRKKKSALSLKNFIELEKKELKGSSFLFWKKDVSIHQLRFFGELYDALNNIDYKYRRRLEFGDEQSAEPGKAIIISGKLPNDLDITFTKFDISKGNSGLKSEKEITDNLINVCSYYFKGKFLKMIKEIG